MKKLLIAAALTASVCSFGANINAQTFDGEGYALEDDAYIVKAAGDASAVTAYGGDNLAVSDKTTAAGGDVNTNTKYLNLSTEGSTLWRTINEFSSENDVETTATKAVAETGTYIDTLVQFTATEEAPTTFEDGAKLAMWLQATDNGDGTATTNLYVRGASITVPTDESVLTATAANVALDATVEAGTWYRLTVKAVTVAAADTQTPITAFAIYIDGVLVNPVTSFVPQAWIDYIRAMEANLESTYFSITDMDLLKTSLVPSVTAGAAGDESLYGVGFKGTGAIDSIAWTDEDLFPSVAPGFTLTIAMSGGVTAAEYTIGDVTADVEGGKIAGLEANTVVTVAAKTIADEYLAPAAQTVTVTADATINLAGVAFADVTTTGDAAITEGNKNTILAWAKTGGNNVDQVEAAAAAGYLSDSYTLNVADLSAEPEIEIVSIVPGDGTTAATVTAKVTVNGVTRIDNLSSAVFNGGATLKYKAATTLSGLDAATAVDTIPTTTEGSQFIKVVVE